MITFSPRVTQLISENRAEGFFCVHILNAGGSVFRASTTHYHDVILGNGITYVADDFIAKMEPPNQSSNIDKEKYKLAVNDDDFFLAAEAENGLVGKRLEVRICFFDPDLPGPLLNLEDTLVAYKGRIHGLEGAIGMEEFGAIGFNITGSSPMMSLDMTRGIYLSKDAIRARNPQDGSCDSIYKGSTPLLQKWGKK